MQQGIHPDYHPVEVTCSCGNTFRWPRCSLREALRQEEQVAYFTPVRFDLACSGIPDRGLAFFVFFDKFCCSIDLRNRIIEQNSTIQKKVCYGRRTVPGGGNRA